MSVLKFDVVGMGANKGDQEGTIFAETGWGVPSSLEAALNLKVVKVLKDLKITVELRGMIETRWSGDKPQVPGDILPVRFAKRFLHLSEVVRDKKEPLHPNEFGMITLPFKMELPSNGLPPTYSDRASSISYYFKVTLIFQESMKLMKTHKELEVPVIVRMPESTRLHLLNSPSPIEHNPAPSPDKCGYSIHIPLRALQPGDTLEAYVRVFSAPQNSIVRSVSACVKTSISYIGQSCSATVSLAKPLAEAAEVVGGSVANNPWSNLFALRLDQSLWRSTFESPLITIKSYFYLEIFLKGSDVANIAVEVPIVLVPAARNDPEKSMTTPSLKSRGSISSEPGMTNSPSAYTPQTPPFQAFNHSPSFSGVTMSTNPPQALSVPPSPLIPPCPPPSPRQTATILALQTPSNNSNNKPFCRCIKCKWPTSSNNNNLNKITITNSNISNNS